MFSLWRKARRENSAASRLLGTTSLRFALHGWQRTNCQCNSRYPGSIKACVLYQAQMKTVKGKAPSTVKFLAVG
ncbi:hypothetical protein, partial [Thiolapillus sp.]|uniref:hypothetical protein n=1 Tax=Thiolapillus sp. TaxID=2017437 RepID=UPI003AF7F3F4